MWASPSNVGVKWKVPGGINPVERGTPLGGPGSWCYLNQSRYAGRPNRATSISGALKRSRQHWAAGPELHCRHHAQFIFYSLLLPLWDKSTPPWDMQYAIDMYSRCVFLWWGEFELQEVRENRLWYYCTAFGEGSQNLNEPVQMCLRVLIHIWVYGNTKSQLFPEKSKGFLAACTKNALTLKEWASLASPGWPGGYFFTPQWLDHPRQLRAQCCLRSQGLGSALKEILTNSSKHWKNRIYVPSSFPPSLLLGIHRGINTFSWMPLPSRRFIWSTVYFVKWEGS